MQSDYDRMKSAAQSSPKEVGYAKSAILRDGCGNLLQVSRLKKW